VFLGFGVYLYPSHHPMRASACVTVYPHSFRPSDPDRLALINPLSLTRPRYNTNRPGSVILGPFSVFYCLHPHFYCSYPLHCIFISIHAFSFLQCFFRFFFFSRISFSLGALLFILHVYLFIALFIYVVYFILQDLACKQVLCKIINKKK
jgi:hypothetical protein